MAMMTNLITLQMNIQTNSLICFHFFLFFFVVNYIYANFIKYFNINF
jgi:hypothetical protein